MHILPNDRAGFFVLIEIPFRQKKKFSFFIFPIKEEKNDNEVSRRFFLPLHIGNDESRK